MKYLKLVTIIFPILFQSCGSNDERHKEKLDSIMAIQRQKYPVSNEAIKNIRVQFTTMGIDCSDAWVDYDHNALYFVINESQTSDANGLAQSFCITAKKSGYKFVMIQNIERITIGKSSCN